MITATIFQLNRLVNITIPPADTDNSYVAINIAIDPSMQLEIYSYGFGYNSISSETSVFSQGNMFATLDFTPQGIVNEFPLLYTNPNAFGEVVLFDSMAMENRNEMFKSVDFANPLIISGRRNFIMIVTKPFTTPAPTAPINIYAYLRGNYGPQMQTKLGNWNLR